MASCIRYIYHELIPKQALNSAFLPAYLEEWLDNNSKKFMYTPLHVSQYPPPHLMIAPWYLDCSAGFVSTSEHALHTRDAETAPVELIELEEDEDEPKEPKEAVAEKETQEKAKKGKKGDKTGFAPKPQALHARVSTSFASKVTAEGSAAPSTTGVGSPFVAPSMVVAVPSQSEATVPSLQKRKLAAPDASVTPSSIFPIYILIKNADMEDLINTHQCTSNHNPIYDRIQQFIAKVCLHIL